MLAGLGFVNRGLLKILSEKEEELQQAGIRFKVTAVADSTGVALHPTGFDMKALLDWKTGGRYVLELPEYSSALRTEDFATTGIGDILVEATPANMTDGQPGLAAARNALIARVPVVFANKAPLVFAYDELHRLAESTGGGPYEDTPAVGIAYSATVCGGLPVVNILRRDLRFARITRVRGILNATSNFILDSIAKGGDFTDAVREAQRIGAAEADPSYDINGNDTANKLYIIAKTIGGHVGSAQETDLSGIQDIRFSDLEAARRRGNTIKLLGTGTRDENGAWRLEVKPEEVPARSFLGQCTGWEMGLEVESDLYERIQLKNYEADPLGTSAAVLRDLLMLAQA